jgi:hypothetical protein
LDKKILYNKYRLPLLLAGTLAMIVLMTINGSSLKTPATPNGIIDLEFAYNASKASAVIKAWEGIGPVDNRFIAIFNTWLDFIFLLFYSLFLYYTCKSFSANFYGFLLNAGSFLAKGSLAAGVLDILENAGMLISLHGHVSDAVAMLTTFFSIIKWILALAALSYILFTGSLLLYQKLRRPG